MDTRQSIRMKLWCDIVLDTCKRTVTLNVATAPADEVLAAFDEAFPAPEPPKFTDNASPDNIK